MLVVVEGRLTWFFFLDLVLLLCLLPCQAEAGQRDDELGGRGDGRRRSADFGVGRKALFDQSVDCCRIVVFKVTPGLQGPEHQGTFGQREPCWLHLPSRPFGPRSEVHYAARL